MDGLRMEVYVYVKTVKRPPQEVAQPQYANYWVQLTPGFVYKN